MIDRPPDVRHPERRQVLWPQQPGERRRPVPRPATSSTAPPKSSSPARPWNGWPAPLVRPPQPGEYLRDEAGIEADDPAIAELARNLTSRSVAGARTRPKPSTATSSSRSPTSRRWRGKSSRRRNAWTRKAATAAPRADCWWRCCRNRGIPARLVTGLTLARAASRRRTSGSRPGSATTGCRCARRSITMAKCPRASWSSASATCRWSAARNVRDLDYAFLVEKLGPEAAGDGRAVLGAARPRAAVALHRCRRRSSGWSSSCCCCRWRR